jgi:hypothetical protein
MILISLLPEWVFYISFFVGCLGTIVVMTLGGLIPIQYKSAIQILSLFLLICGSFFIGGITNETKWQLKVKEMEAVVAKQELAAEKITNEVITKYVDRVKIVEGKTREIIKKVPVYITKESDDKCIINNGFVSLHDSSASQTKLSDSTGDVNEAASKIKLSDVATTVSQNYGTYYQVSEQLKSLQKWILEQKELSDGK